MNDKISRKKFIQKVGFGLTNVSVLSLLGCQNDTEYGTPRIVTPHLSSNRLAKPQYDNQGYDGIYDKYASWIPLHYNEDKARWNAIVIHHTATKTGSASIIDKIHRNRRFDGLGYDFIINNGNGNPDGL